MRDWKRIEQIAGLSLVALIVVGCGFVLKPFVTSILWAAILCYTTWPLFGRLERICGSRRNAAAGIMTILITVVMVVPFTFVGLTFAENLAGLVARIDEVRRQGLPPPPAWVGHVPLAGGKLAELWQSMAGNANELAPLIGRWFTENRAWLLQRSLSLGRGILELILSVVIAFFFYRDGARLVERVAEGIRRITGDQAHHMLETVGRTVKAVVYGLLGTALAQGIAAGIGFKIAGIPAALLWALITFFLALVPFGPPLVWLPVTAWLFLQDRPGWGVFMLIWGAGVISSVDNIIRPMIISQGTKLPFALVLLGVLGGLAAFGFIGVFLGPTVLAVGYGFVLDFLRHKPAARNGAHNGHGRVPQA